MIHKVKALPAINEGEVKRGFAEDKVLVNEVKETNKRDRKILYCHIVGGQFD